MISRYKATMDGVLLNSIHEMLQVLDIRYETSEMQRNMARRASGSGVYATNPYRQSTSVTIDFELHIYDTRERQRVCQQVIQWARGSVLQTSDRPGQRLHVVCDGYPAIESALRWTDPLSVTFTAYALPYWEEEFPATATLTNASGTLFVPGNVSEQGAKVDAEITANAALTALTLAVGSNSITLSGISVPKNGKIIVSHDENGHLSIKYGNTSLLNKRTGSDDLLAENGKTSTVRVSGNAACKFSVRGLWM